MQVIGDCDNAIDHVYGIQPEITSNEETLNSHTLYEQVDRNSAAVERRGIYIRHRISTETEILSSVNQEDRKAG
jgi:hypothetical protein